MASSTVYRASEACALAGIDNKRFNEAVAKELYPCAPVATRGSARMFSEDDVVALFVYARLLEQEVPQRLAGQAACKVRSKIEEAPEAKEVKVQKLSGQEEQELGPEFDGEKVEASFHVYWVFDVGGVREYIRAAAQAAQSDMGE